MKLTSMCGSDPSAVHKVLDDYADAVSKLHVAMSPSYVKVEGAALKQAPTSYTTKR